MKVYRVEHKTTKIGPYRKSNTNFLLNGADHTERRPDPFKDGISFYDVHQYEFGFSSRKQLLDWFPLQMLITLRGMGYRVVSFEVPDNQLRVGGKQVAYRKEARHGKQVTPNRYFSERTIVTNAEVRGSWITKG